MPVVTESASLLDAHLNVHWLRPESALWDAIASSVVARAELPPPSLDLGCGNGLFSFITAGGRFSPEYDWYRNVDLERAGEGGDLYDALGTLPRRAWITEEPRHQFDWGLDAKATLLEQAKALGFYRQTALADANGRLPWPDESLQSVFSNMLYWLTSAEAALRELRRILRPGGRAWLCLPDPAFLACCTRRRDAVRWTVSAEEWEALAARTGFRAISATRYLSPLTLKVWDIGLRPVAGVLIKMVHRLSEADRLALKLEWMDCVRPFLWELYEQDQREPRSGGFHFVGLEKG
ncbi:MAG: methyltransferase domain-containing protein [Candidatus Omnitrophica bacterium]|nr:methyltransferase domain-containing protein [Candidatus Omnitrophota bacterium]